MSLLRRSLESYDTTPTNNVPMANVNDGVNQTIVMKGPLSEIYTKALNMAYAKTDKLTQRVEPVEDRTIVPDTKTNGMAPPASPMLEPVALEDLGPHTERIKKLVAALESQQIDATLMEKLSKTLTAAEEPVAPTDSFQTIYGVSRDNLNDSDLVEVTKEIAVTPKNENSEYFVVIDRTGSDDETPDKIVQLGNAMETVVNVFGGKVFHSLEEYVHYQATRIF